MVLEDEEQTAENISQEEEEKRNADNTQQELPSNNTGGGQKAELSWPWTPTTTQGRAASSGPLGR